MPGPLNVNLVLGLVAIVAVASTVLSMLALGWVTRRGRGRGLPEYTPPVTIFKPLKGLDEELEANLRSFFHLDYPVYQLLFGVADAGDPAIAVVQKLMGEHPDRDTRLVVGAPAFGLNPKVENLASMARFRKYDVILISDSNVRVRPSYLRETAKYLAEPGVGLVTNLFAGVGEIHSGAIMENLQLNGFIAGGMALASVLRVTCVVGKSMLMPVKVLEAIGGFARVRNLLAEDQVIGVLVRKAGYSIRLSHHVIDNINRRRGFNWFLNRHSRWYKIRRQMALYTFLSEPMANLATVGLVWAFSGDSGIAWGRAGGSGRHRHGTRDALQTRWLSGRFPGAAETALFSHQGRPPAAALVRRDRQLARPVAGPSVPRRPADPVAPGPRSPRRPPPGAPGQEVPHPARQPRRRQPGREGHQQAARPGLPVAVLVRGFAESESILLNLCGDHRMIEFDSFGHLRPPGERGFLMEEDSGASESDASPTDPSDPDHVLSREPARARPVAVGPSGPCSFPATAPGPGPPLAALAARRSSALA